MRPLPKSILDGALFPSDGPGDGSTSTGSAPRAATPGRPDAPSPRRNPGPGARRRGTPTTGSLVGADFSQWFYWWELNKEPFFPRDFLRDTTTGTGDGGRPHRVSKRFVRAEMTPTLSRLLEDPRTDRYVIRSAMFALARLDTGSDEVITVLKRHLKSYDSCRSECAALALGVAGRPEALPLLLDLVRDAKNGRRAVLRPRVPYRTRSFACFALGLLGKSLPTDRERLMILGELTEVIDSRARDDVRAAALHGIGLLEPDTGTVGGKLVVRDAVTHLIRIVGDPKRKPGIRAHACTALARIARPFAAARSEAVSALLGRLRVRRENRYVHGSAILALGHLAREVDGDVVDRIGRYMRQGRHRDLRGFAAIALGRIGGAASRQTLLRYLGASRCPAMQRPWLALGLALLDHGARADDPTRGVDRTSAEAILAVLAKTRNHELASGLAVALGIMRFRSAAKTLRQRVWQARFQSRAAGYYVQALGLIGDERAKADILAIVGRAKRYPGLLSQSVLALGMLGDREVASALVTRLESTECSSFVKGALAQALGHVGKQREALRLLALVDDDELPGTTRAAAASALGLIGDRDALPWHARVAAGLNYRANFETLWGNGHGVLDHL